MTLSKEQIQGIVKALFTRNGKLQKKGPSDPMARYVWHWVRFHVGINVNLDGLMMGTMMLPDGAPKEELEQIAGYIAHKMTGRSESTGLSAWHRAFYGE